MKNRETVAAVLKQQAGECRASSDAETSGHISHGQSRNILVIHTGGTIGMVPGPFGLTPGEGVLERAIERLAPDLAKPQVHAFQPLVDSAEINPADWIRIIDLVMEFEGDGVIVTHGTDTMAFTGAALSQALAGLPIPVILCGSMKPLGMHGDAEANLSLAIDAIGGELTGVWLAFAGKLLPAAGLVKHNSKEADAFRSTPQDPLPPRRGKRHFADLNLAVITLTPAFPVNAITALLSELDGAVLRVFGSGTMPSDPRLEAALTAAIRRGCRIRAVSQCETGGLEPGTYAAGAGLWRAGVENGGSETPEAALARLWLDMSADRL